MIAILYPAAGFITQRPEASAYWFCAGRLYTFAQYSCSKRLQLLHTLLQADKPVALCIRKEGVCNLLERSVRSTAKLYRQAPCPERKPSIKVRVLIG